MPSRSPLKAKPLRNPGESLHTEIEAVVGQTAMGYYIGAAMLTFLAGMEWIGYLTHAPRRPVLYTLMAGVALTLFVVKFVIIRRKVKQLKLGRDGERCVGQFLERLREADAQVVHDIPGEGFNLDHVVIARQGIYLIETKTRSKPYPDARVVVRDESLTVAGHLPDRDPIVQAKAGARWLQALLKESTGKSLNVRPVVVFPGWYVEQVEPRGAVWVLEPKQLPALIAKERAVLDFSEVKLAAFHLSRYVRAIAEQAA